jgi:Protein of unknown function (DUF2911)
MKSEDGKPTRWRGRRVGREPLHPFNTRAARMPPSMLRHFASLILVATPAIGAYAQRPHDAEGFVVCLGEDTLAVERYSRSATTLESEIVLRVPAARRVTYTAALDAVGDVRSMELVVTPLLEQSQPPRVSRGRLHFRGDTADVQLTLDDGTRVLKVPARPGSMPLAAFSHALVEQAILRTSRLGLDSMAFDWVGVGAPVAYPTYVSRRGDGAIVIGFFDAPAVATMDSSGRMLALDGSATTAKVEVRRVHAPDLEHFARSFAAAEAAHGPVGQLSPRDTTWGEIGHARVMVDYGRPSRRGRVVFGHVVPWGRVWRTGANEATQFTTDTPLSIGGQAIPAGTYSLWTVPRPDGATLIVNRRTGQWGTHYEQSLDLARVEMARETLVEPLEQFTIGIESWEDGGMLRLSWDSTSYLVPVSVVTRH